MTRIIDRYIFRELLPPFCLSLILFIFIFLTNQVLRLMSFLINKGVEILTILKILAYITPSFLVLTLPMAVLISSIAAFNRLSQDREILAMRASGISPYRLFIPVGIFSLIIYLFTALLSLYAQPWSGQSMKNLAFNILKKEITIGLEEGKFNDLINNIIIYIDRMPEPQSMQGIFISDMRDPDNPSLIVAREGDIITEQASNRIEFILKDGSVNKKGRSGSVYQRIVFSTYSLKFDLTEELRKGGRLDSPSVNEIKMRIAQTGGKDTRYLRLLEEYYKNFSFPFASIIFGFLGVPLGIYSRYSGRLGGFAIGIAMIVTYYILSIIGDSLVLSRALSPVYSAWLPNSVFILLAIYFVIRTGRGDN